MYPGVWTCVQNIGCQWSVYDFSEHFYTINMNTGYMCTESMGIWMAPMRLLASERGNLSPFNIYFISWMAGYFFKCFYVQSIVTELCFKSLKTIEKVHLLITKYQALFAGFKLPVYQNQASLVSVCSHRQYSNLMQRKSWPNSEDGISAIRGYSPPFQSNWFMSLSESCLLCLWKAYQSLCI